MNAIAYAIQLMTALPGLIQAGKDVVGVLSEGKASLERMQSENRDPSPTEWAALNALIDSLQAELHAP